MKNRLLPWIATLALGVPSCTPSPIDVNFGVVRVQPPANYIELWEEVEACSEIEGAFEAVTWYLADGFEAGRTVVGQWSPPHSITILRGFQQQAGVVKHEILHDLLQGDEFHDELAWIRCRLLSV